VGGLSSPPRLPEVLMVPVITQIEAITSVRAVADYVRPYGSVPEAIRSNGPAKAAKNDAGKAQPRAAPVANDHGLRLSVNSNTHEVVATLVNTQTNEVIRTIPGEETRRAGDVIRSIPGQVVDKLA
jgi:FlaG protein